MAITHATIKAPGQKIFAVADWNTAHTGTATPANHGNEAHTSVFITGAQVPANETDPVYSAWIAGPPNVSTFTNDSGYLTAEADTLNSVLVRGDTSANQNLTLTAGTATAEQVTSTDDMTMSGYFLDTLSVADATGIYIDGTTNPFTGVNLNYGIRLERIIAGASSALSFATNGIYANIANTYAKNGPDFETGDTMQNTGHQISVAAAGVHTGNIPGFIETNMGLTVLTSRSGSQCTIDTSGGPPSPAVFTNIGVDAWGSSQTTFNNANSDFQNDVYGLRIYATNLPTNTASTSLTSNTYGAYIYARGNNAGTSTNYGLYLDSCSGADTNWGIYVNSSANSFLGNDNAKSYFGTGKDASIYYDGTDMFINPKEVGTGVLQVLGSQKLTGTITAYNNIATVSMGIPAERATVDLTGQTAAKGATTIYTPAASGMFRISIVLQVTTAATTSSVLGGATGVTITFTEPDGSIAQSIKPLLTSQAGAVIVPATGNTGNATTTQSQGVGIIYAKTGVAIQYAIGYTSVGATPMAYSAHLKVEAM